VNPGRAPGRVRLVHRLDEIEYFARDGRPPRWSSTTLPAPELSRPATVPGNDRFRPDHGERPTPTGPEPRQGHPQPAIGWLQRHASARALALEHRDLVAEREQLRLEVGATANGVTSGSEKGDENGIHHPTLPTAVQQRNPC